MNVAAKALVPTPDLMHRSRSTRLGALCLAIGVFAVVAGRPCSAQQSAPATLQAGDSPQVQRWKFGLTIDAAGPVSGIHATVPVPVEWPEQTVSVVSIDKSPGVDRATIKELSGDASQLALRINQLAAGQSVEASVTMDITKHTLGAPQDTDPFQFASRPAGSLRKFLQPSPYIESSDARIKQLAAELPINSSDSAWRQVETIYQWVRENIQYKFDPTIRSCTEALDRGQGDCEELSSLFIALCRARGIPARAVWIPDHTYPEFYLVDSQGNGRWFPCQVAGDYEFGQMTESRPILQKGDKFDVPGHAKPLRYVQPTLTAKDAMLSPAVGWIMQQVVDQE